MSAVKLFYSYSHSDKSSRKKLETHLATLREQKIIDEWHDRKIKAGDDWNKEIQQNMEDSNIILLLFSPDFIASPSCIKEVGTAMRLKNEKGTLFIPIILKSCAWRDVDGISKIQALPADAKPISSWNDVDEAWSNVYDGIKRQVQEIRKKITPELQDSFKKELLRNPTQDCALNKIFVYPDILEITKESHKLENNEINSAKLKDIKKFQHKCILIEGDNQSGKTSLCAMLYMHYVDAGFYPIQINGEDIKGKADIKNIVNKVYGKQYKCTDSYWVIDKQKTILLIDDVADRKVTNKNYNSFIESITSYFEYAIVFIDKLSNLSDKSAEHNYFYQYYGCSIIKLGHKKRNELLKKCISNNENTDFDINNKDQVARLDKDSEHIKRIIGTNILPSYPIFIISMFDIIETTMLRDKERTSYGHCYHSIITIQLLRSNILPGQMDEYFNFLTEFSYYLFSENKKNIQKEKLDRFFKDYCSNYIVDENVINKLTRTNILKNNDDSYSFEYIYIYYYFVAKYISDHINDPKVKRQIEELMLAVHKKDNYNIVVFITHHTKDEDLLDNILLNSMSTFERFTEATLIKEEISFIYKGADELGKLSAPPKGHNVEKERTKQLEKRDEIQPKIDEIDDDIENTDDPLMIEIRKSAKSMEIIGQIMRNQYGTFRKDRLAQLFEEGQNVGLRLLKSFIDLLKDYPEALETATMNILSKNKNLEKEKLSDEEMVLLKKKYATIFSYSVIFGWLNKIVDSLGYDKLIEISDHVNNKTNSPASELINISIHTWYKKEININEIKKIYAKFYKDNNYLVMYMLKNIVINHLYMHKISNKQKQKINSFLNFPIYRQEVIQHKLQENRSKKRT